MAQDVNRGLFSEIGKVGRSMVKPRNVADSFRKDSEELHEKPNYCQTSVKQSNTSINQNRTSYVGSIGNVYEDDVFQRTEADSSQNTYICDTCNKRYKSITSITKHVQCHMYNRQLYKCKYCSKELTTKGSHTAHERLHTDEKLFKCKVCKLSFHTKKILELHHKKMHCSHSHYICEVCGLSFHTARYLKEHSSVHNGEKRFACKFCEKTFRKSRQLNEHMKTQHLRLPCDKCDLICSSRGQLKKHQMVHLDRPFKCDQCESCFTRKLYLRRHKVIHSGIKPHKCDTCGAAYADKNHLYRHLKSKHFCSYKTPPNTSVQAST